MLSLPIVRLSSPLLLKYRATLDLRGESLPLPSARVKVSTLASNLINRYIVWSTVPSDLYLCRDSYAAGCQLISRKPCGSKLIP